MKESQEFKEKKKLLELRHEFKMKELTYFRETTQLTHKQILEAIEIKKQAIESSKGRGYEKSFYKP